MCGPVFAGSTASTAQGINARTQTQQAGGLGQTKSAQLAVPLLDALDRSTKLGRADASTKLIVTVSMPFADPEGMQRFVDSVSDPLSPDFRQFLTPEEVGARFGLPADRVQAIADYLQSKGLNVTLVSKNRLGINCEGTVAQLEAAFGTTIDQFESKTPDTEPGNAKFIAPSKPLSVPANIAGDIIDVAGLETYTKPMHRVLTMAQARGVYNVSPIYSASFQGTGRTIGMSSWDGFRLTNVPLWYTYNSLPTPSGGVGSNVHVVTVGGGTGSGTPQGEADLDIQMILGQAPLCDLYIYDGAGSNLVAVLTKEVSDNLCDIISESYGWNVTNTTANSAHNQHLSMTAQGITYMAASGDSGTTIEPYSYPNYDPEVLMVGGTIATANAGGTRNTEVGWSSGGGGWSTKTVTWNTRPSWQVGTGVSTTINYRMSPDLAGNAAGTSGAYRFYLNGSLASGYTGTSFASPVFAGMLGVAEQKLISLGGLPANGAGKRRFGRIQDVIYAQNGRTDVWYDVVSGSNGTLPNGSTSSCTAKWDFVTGWGCMNMDAFVTTQVPCLGDLDNSGSVDGGDLGLLLLDFGPCAGCVSDIDGSGTVDGGDLGLLLLNFGPC